MWRGHSCPRDPYPGKSSWVCTGAARDRLRSRSADRKATVSQSDLFNTASSVSRQRAPCGLRAILCTLCGSGFSAFTSNTANITAAPDPKAGRTLPLLYQGMLQPLLQPLSPHCQNCQANACDNPAPAPPRRHPEPTQSKQLPPSCRPIDNLPIREKAKVFHVEHFSHPKNHEGRDIRNCFRSRLSASFNVVRSCI